MMYKVFFGSFLICFLSSFNTPVSSECDIEEFYNAVDPGSGTKILTKNDELEEAELILVPTDLKVGNYVINITRRGSNLYEIENKKIYIETKYCYEYATHQEVVLKVTSNYGYTKGKIIF